MGPNMVAIEEDEDEEEEYTLAEGIPRGANQQPDYGISTERRFCKGGEDDSGLGRTLGGPSPPEVFSSSDQHKLQQQQYQPQQLLPEANFVS